jgi:hypothetical protein
MLKGTTQFKNAITSAAIAFMAHGMVWPAPGLDDTRLS